MGESPVNKRSPMKCYMNAFNTSGTAFEQFNPIEHMNTQGFKAVVLGGSELTRTLPLKSLGTICFRQQVHTGSSTMPQWLCVISSLIGQISKSTAFSPLADREFDKTKTPVATSDANFVKMTTFPLQCIL